MADAINLHKQIAMGKSPKVEAAGKSVMPKYAKGGAVMAEGKASTLINDSSRKNPLPRPMPGNEGKIATLKKGGMPPKRGMGITIAVAVPARKAAGRGR